MGQHVTSVLKRSAVGRSRRSLVAVLALAHLALMLTASPAVASNFASTAAPFVLQGSGTFTNSFSIGSTELRCSSIAVNGTESSATPGQITLAPTYGECTFEPFGAAAVKMSGCTYVFGSTTSAGQGQLAINCSGTNAIEIVASGCTVKIGSQTVWGAEYTNFGSGSSASFEAFIVATGFAYTKSGALCFLISGTTTYWGGVWIHGYEDWFGSAGPAIGIKYVK